MRDLLRAIVVLLFAALALITFALDVLIRWTLNAGKYTQASGITRSQVVKVSWGLRLFGFAAIAVVILA